MGEMSKRAFVLWMSLAAVAGAAIGVGTTLLVGHVRAAGAEDQGVGADRAAGGGR